MGKTIVSWSPVHGQAATTANTVSLAILFSIEYQVRTLLTHTQITYSSLESLLGKGNKDNHFTQTGIKALERLVKSRLLRPDSVIDYTTTIYRDRLDLLGGILQESENGLLEEVIAATKDVYDTVWIDAHSGLQHASTVKLLEKADLVLINLPQNRFVLDEFFYHDGFPEILKTKKCIILISEYDMNSSISIRKIKRQYEIGDNIYPIPYSHYFKDACNQQKLPEYFLRQYGLQKKSPSYEFIKALQDVISHIGRELDLTGQAEEDEE